MAQEAKKEVCRVCGGEGWLPSLPEGQSTCPYCKGEGKCVPQPLPKVKR